MKRYLIIGFIILALVLVVLGIFGVESFFDYEMTVYDAPGL